MYTKKQSRQLKQKIIERKQKEQKLWERNIGTGPITFVYQPMENEKENVNG
jgi:ABC-type phosphate transport system substrate-binding protein